MKTNKRKKIFFSKVMKFLFAGLAIFCLINTISLIVENCRLKVGDFVYVGNGELTDIKKTETEDFFAEVTFENEAPQNFLLAYYMSPHDLYTGIWSDNWVFVFCLCDNEVEGKYFVRDTPLSRENFQNIRKNQIKDIRKKNYATILMTICIVMAVKCVEKIFFTP